MEIAFDSKRLRQICEQEWVAREALRHETAEFLIHRLADIHAASSIADLLVGSPRVTTRGGRDVILIELGRDHRLILAPNHPTNPVTSAGVLDWTKVRRLKVLQIEEERS